MMKFAHLADVHLGYEQYSQSWRADDFARVFKEAVSKCIEEDVDFVIISGDLFHRSVPNPKTIKEAIDTLSILKKKKIPVFAIEGNHDKTVREISVYHLLESLGLLNVLGLRRRRIENEYVTSTRLGENAYLVKGYFNGVEIVGERHRTKWQLEKILPFLKPESDESILVLHQSIKEVVDVDINLAYELTLSELPKASYYAMGHVHIPKTYRYMGRMIVYPGSLERYDTREASHIISYLDRFSIKDGVKKGFFIVEDFNPRFIEVHARNLYTAYVESSTAGDLKDKLLEILDKVDKEGILIAKLVCNTSVDVKNLSEIALKRLKYADIRFEMRRKEVVKTEILRENEFFNDFELELLEMLKDDFEARRDEIIEFIKRYFNLTGKKVDEKAEIKSENQKKIPMKVKKGRTLFDFFEGD